MTLENKHLHRGYRMVARVETAAPLLRLTRRAESGGPEVKGGHRVPASAPVTWPRQLSVNLGGLSSTIGNQVG